MRKCAVRLIVVVLVACFAVACSDSVTDTPVVENLVENGSFEIGGEPSLAGWSFGLSDLARSVHEAPPAGGAWCLELSADWAPTSGFAFVRLKNVREGDVLRLSAFVRAIGANGGGAIELRIGSSRITRAESSDTLWTYLSVVDTVGIDQQDSVEVRLTSFITEIVPRIGLFDLVRLERVK